MATGRVHLPLAAAVVPDGSASNLAPQIRRAKSSAAAPTPYWIEYLFDAGQTEQLMWSFKMPGDYSSAPVLVVEYKMASATTNEVRLDALLLAYTPDSDTDNQDANAFGSSNAVDDTVPATTAGKIATVSITLTNADSVAANDYCVIYFARLGGHANDDATGDMELLTATLTYTTT